MDVPIEVRTEAIVPLSASCRRDAPARSSADAIVEPGRPAPLVRHRIRATGADLTAAAPGQPGREQRQGEGPARQTRAGAAPAVTSLRVSATSAAQPCSASAAHRRHGGTPQDRAE